MKAYVFPGQGAQHKGMGHDLFDRFPELVREANGILGYSIAELCLLDPQRRLGQTQYTQPALYIVNALAYYAAAANSGARPDLLAGHSLGEYNALLAAEAFDFGTGLKLVQKRGELMSRAQRGGMAAVIGMEADQLSEVLRRSGLTKVHIANINSPSQIVISGDQDEIASAQAAIEGVSGVRYVRLNVSGAFHSPLMQAASEEFGNFCRNFTFRDPEIPVISNVTARPYSEGQVMDLLVRQITSSVQWNDSVRYMLAKGVTDFVETGPGQVLTKLVAQIRQQAAPLILEGPGKTDIAAVDANDYAVASPAPVPLVSSPYAPERISASTTRLVEQVRTQPAPAVLTANVSATQLGSSDFMRDYNLKYAYLAGSMYKGIASRELVARMGKAGFMGFLGAGGMKASDIEQDLRYIQAELTDKYSYGCNLLHTPAAPKLEEDTVDLLLRLKVRNVEASAYMQITPALVRYKLQGLEKRADGTIVRRNRIIAKLSHTEVARAFLNPAPERIVQQLLAAGLVTKEQAELALHIPVADELCVEADSGGHTDRGVAYALFPAVVSLRDEILAQRQYPHDVRIGAAGGIGTPQAAMAAFMLGADFIVTGSINQCTVEARTSDAVKDILQDINVKDTDYAPAGDMFEIGAKVQVVKRGLFFPARANKLYELYRQHNSLDDIDEKTRKQIEDKYFKRSFEQVWEETSAYYRRKHPAEIERAEQSPKHKMALIFRWYFVHTTRLALSGDVSNKVDFQIHCGSALGGFNQWVKGTALESWRNRHVDVIGLALLNETGSLIGKALQRYARSGEQRQPEEQQLQMSA